MTNQPLIPLSYASPIPLAIHGDLFQQADTLIVRDNTVLPERCILCASLAPSIPRKNPIILKFSWDASFQRTQSRSTLELRRAGCIHAYLCPGHLRSYRIGRIAGFLGMFVGALLMIASALLALLTEISVIPRYTPLAMAGLIAGFALVILFLFFFTLRTRTLSCTKIEDSYLHLTGVHPNFLKTLPPLPA
ncbi:MAG: hypothetical protein FWD61_18515 [Phycisphaerales bacterium]|nr:hypothetical protein [Phycisphaerales bacterium]